MKIEFVAFAITAFFIANTYYDGKYMAILKSWKKYYQMIGIGFAGLSAYLFFKKYPSDTRTLISSASGVIRHLPVDKSAADIFEPFIQLTKYSGNMDYTHEAQRVRQSGSGEGASTKRCVSETKKKYVAAQQGWNCGRCQRQLPAWFEVDHTVRLENGGSNHVDNLVALCRDCHGEKTALENL
jgi:hypothetical protein